MNQQREDHLMTTEQDLRHCWHALGSRGFRQAAIAHIRSSGRTRRVGGRRSNVTGRLFEQEDGVAIQLKAVASSFQRSLSLSTIARYWCFTNQVPADGKRLGVMQIQGQLRTREYAKDDARKSVTGVRVPSILKLDREP